MISYVNSGVDAGSIGEYGLGFGVLGAEFLVACYVVVLRYTWVHQH